MDFTRLQAFVEHLRAANGMPHENILQAINHIKVIDRRIGQLSTIRGFIKPEIINTILLEQTRNGLLFGECALRLNLMDARQVQHLLKLQTDDLFLFAHAVVMLRLTTLDKIVDHLAGFIKAHPDLAKPAGSALNGKKAELDQQVRAVLKNIDQVSALPSSATRVLSMLDEPGVDLDKVAQVLSTDPGLTVTLLRIVNSASFGLRESVTKINKAVTVMGTKKLREMVVSASVMNKFQNVPEEFSTKFWDNALRAAQWSKEIGILRHYSEPDRLFVCGLLHNIGELLLLQHFPAMYHNIEEQVAAGGGRMDAQRAVIGGTTADMASFLFNIWKMPNEMIQSTMFHHTDLNLLMKTPSISEEVFIVHMAAAIVGIDPSLDTIQYREQAVSVGNRYRDALKLGLNFSMNNLLDKVESSIGELIASGCAA